MAEAVKGIFKPFIILVILALILSVGFFTSFYSSYDKNLFEVKLNEELMKCYYTEKYSSGFIIKAKTEGFNAVENNINSLNLEDKFILKVNEYETYYSNGYRKEAPNDWLMEDSISYKKVEDTAVKLKIKRKGKVLYDGVYISDITNYLKENGRYYIHIYSTRKNNLLSSVKTHISFNVIVGGGNLYEKNKITSS